MANRRKKKTTFKRKILTYTAWLLAVVALVLGTFIFGYFYGYESSQKELAQNELIEKSKKLTILKENTTKHKDVNTRLKEVLKKETKVYSGASHEYDDVSLKKAPLRVDRETKLVSSKPKLAIIIDDVSIRSHVAAIKAVGIPLTMSFLPPSANRPNSAKLAAQENFYMVHLPLEAQNFTAEEPFTMRVEDSQQNIYKRIKELKKLFPRVTHINNHTGSKFTSDELAMNRLIYALNSQGISFIDSRTTAETKAPKVMKNYGFKYVARDVFLDHENDKAYVKKQIKKAIKIAKLHGTAIAIGHPHANTILALSESKELFKEVELVYINKLN